MKNKFSIGIITVFIAIFTSILFLNLSDFFKKEKKYFDRIYSKDSILIFKKEFRKFTNKGIKQMFFSNESICEGETVEKLNKKNKNSYKFYFSNILFTRSISKNFEIDSKSNVLMVDSKSIIYWKNSKLHKLDLNTNIINVSPLQFFDISFFITTNDENEYLIFGEVFINNIYKTGFFNFNFLTGKITDSYLLKKDMKSFNPDIIIAHSGYFQKIENSMLIYTCDKNPYIYIFNEHGLFLNKLITKDNSKLPKIIKDDKNNFFFSRSNLTFTNCGVFFKDKFIYIFSMATEENKYIVIDKYNLLDNEYIESFKLSFKNHVINDINSVFADKENVVLKFDNSYALFKISRYE